MNLGKRCNAMLENHTQCSNTAVVDSEFCVLHNELIKATKIADEKAKEEQQIEQIQNS